VHLRGHAWTWPWTMRVDEVGNPYFPGELPAIERTPK
jgi:hypothetical protein